MIFQEKYYFSFYILLTDKISLSDYLYFLKYWATYVLQLFVNQVGRSYILKLTFFYITKKSKQKFKYLEY